MKVTTEKLPKSLVALDIELDNEQVEKGLERAARRLSQKYNVPGFRKGKAPRFIIENYFGREALVEEASNDLIQKAFKKVLDQEQIRPIGPANLDSVQSAEPFRFRVTVPVSPSVTLPDYRSIRIDLDLSPITDEIVQQAMDTRREKHVILQELDEPRPAQAGDQLTVKLETFVDGESLEQYPEGQEVPDTPLVLEQGRLLDELYEGLLGTALDEQREIVVQMPDDHANEQVRGKEVTFQVRVIGIQGRILPEWDEVPVLEGLSETLDEFRAQTRQTLEANMRAEAESNLVRDFIEQITEQSTYDVPDVLVRDFAEDLLKQQEQEFSRYGISLEQILTYRNETRDQAIDSLLPLAEERLKTQLSLLEVVKQEQLDITEAEVHQEANLIMQTLDENTINTLAQQQQTVNRFLTDVANSVLDRKLRQRLVAIATGEAPALPEPASGSEESGDTEMPTHVDHTDSKQLEDTSTVQPDTEESVSASLSDQAQADDKPVDTTPSSSL